MRTSEYRRKANKRWREKNKKYVLQRAQKYKARIKHEVFSHYCKGEPRCQCPSGNCPNNHIEFLCIDHINGGGNKHRKECGKRTSTGMYVWLIKHRFPSGFRVLCAACNQAYGIFGYCPHCKS